MAAATPNSVPELLGLLQKSRIWPDADLRTRLAAIPPPPDDPLKAAAHLVKHGLLTPFQARVLMGGKYRGFRLGAYVIRDQVGQGGMGAVYLAHHETLRRPVAIKVLTAGDSGPTSKVDVGRFLREARSAAALDHPNIVRIFDVAQLGEMHYLVLEYVEGQTLEQLVTSGGPVPCARAVEYILQAAAGLEHAYQKGFVHRDIKPANLILSKDGTVKILDMGLARSDETADKVTEVFDKGAVVGTADYISPEQAMNAPDLDIRADIYSLGATFFTLVTGKPPFAGNTTQKLMQHQIKDPPSLAALDRTFPPELAAVVAKMMRKRPAERYQTPGEVMAALGPWLSNTSQVVAALSRAESRSSPDLQQTLNEVVTGSTKRLPALPPDAPKPRRPARRLVAGGVAAAALTLTLAGLGAYALSGPATRDPVVTTTPKPNPPTPPAATPPAATPPAATTKAATTKAATTKAAVPAGGRVSVYAFDAATLPNFRERWRTDADGATPGRLAEAIISTTGDGKLPDGWQRMNYGAGTVSEVAIDAVGGVKAFSVTTVEGDPTTMVFSPHFDSTQPGLRVRLAYRTDGSVGEALLKFRPTVPAADDGWNVAKLPATGGQWVEREFPFDARSATRGQVEFHTSWLDRGKALWVKSFDITAVAAGSAANPPPANPLPAGSKVLYRSKFNELEPFAESGTSYKDEQNNDAAKVASHTGPGVFPPEWRLISWKPDTVQESTAAEWRGVKALGVRVAAGEATTILFGPEVAFPNSQTRVRIEYAIGGAKGVSHVRLMPRSPKPGPAKDVQVLPATMGQWQSADFELDVGGSTAGCLELHTSGLPVGETLWVKSITVYQPAN